MLMGWPSYGAGSIPGLTHTLGPGLGGSLQRLEQHLFVHGISQAAISEPSAFSHMASGLPWYVSCERDSRYGSVTSGAPQHHSDVSFRCRDHKGLLGVQGRGAQTAPLGGRPAWLWKNLFGKDNLPHTEADWRHVCQTTTLFFK